MPMFNPKFIIHHPSSIIHHPSSIIYPSFQQIRDLLLCLTILCQKAMDGNPLDMPKLEVWGDPISLVSMMPRPRGPGVLAPRRSGRRPGQTAANIRPSSFLCILRKSGLLDPNPDLFEQNPDLFSEKVRIPDLGPEIRT